MRDGIAYPGRLARDRLQSELPVPPRPHGDGRPTSRPAFVVLAVGARYLVAGSTSRTRKTMVRMAIGMMAVLAPLQLFIGDQHGLEHAQASADQDRRDGRPLGRLASPATSTSSRGPTRRTRRNLFEISIPRGSSLILTHDPNGLFPGLKSVPPRIARRCCRCSSRFRIMVGIGLLMIATGAVRRVPVVARQAVRDALVSSRIVAVRLVDRLRRDPRRLGRHRERPPAVARLRHPAHRGRDLAGARPRASLTTLVLFVIVYGIVFSMGIYYINRLINARPAGQRDRGAADGAPSRPLSAAEDAARDAH